MFYQVYLLKLFKKLIEGFDILVFFFWFSDPKNDPVTLKLPYDQNCDFYDYTLTFLWQSFMIVNGAVEE